METMDNVLLTICIPTYNRANYLELAINSVIAQTLKTYRLIILDNASTDSTKNLVEKYNDPRISYLVNEKNIPVNENINRAFDIVKTKYLTIFHDDDEMHPDLLETQIKQLEENDRYVLVACDIQSIDSQGNYLNDSLNLSEDIIFKQFDYWESYYFAGIYLPMPTVMFRTQFIKEHGFKFSGEVGPNFDQFLWLQINLLNVEFLLTKEKLYFYRRHSGQSNNWYWYSILLNSMTYEIAKEHHIAKVFEKIDSEKVHQKDYLFRIHSEEAINLIMHLTKSKFFRLSYWDSVKLLMGKNTPFVLEKYFRIRDGLKSKLKKAILFTNVK